MATQEAIFPEFVEDLVLQNGTESERGRAAVLEFRDREKPDIRTFDTLGLKAYLDDPAKVLNPSINSHQHPRRRIFLLEDLGRSKVEIIGSRLRIPPAFFGAHWNDPSFAIRVADQDSLAHNHSKYFRVAVPQIHRISQENRTKGYPLGLYKDPKTNIQRFLQLLDKDRKFEVSYHQVSYWSTNHGTGWTAVFLVDPLITQASLSSFYAQNGSYLLHLEHPNTGDDRLPTPHPLSMEPLATDHKSWQNVAPKLNATALFDNIISSYTTIAYPDTSDLRISTLACRHLSLSMWQTLLGSRRLEYDRLSDNLLNQTPPDDSHGWFYTWDLRWRTESFRRLLYQQMTVASICSTIRATMRKLGIESTAAVVDSREVQDWQTLLEDVSTLNEKITTLITGYTQEVTIQESQTSNYQARSVGRLTSLAMILVPFSITAAVLSMGGEFSAGQRLFWVFWVIAIPVAIVLFFGLFTRALDLFGLLTRKLDLFRNRRR